ncbi:unnamed protein product [Linum tenue]|nr:unnamed protein product [Linum tenue]
MSSIPDIFVGREDDVRYIKEFLFAKESSTNVAAVSIAGIGGMGKTSLAQLVYNDEDVVQEFNLRLWVCVSESFEVDAILQRIVDTATGQKQPSFQRQSLCNFVEEYFTREKYLLVLDDLCNLECRKWDFLGSILEGGASGSKILITTRFENYAIMMSRGSFRPPYVLHGLSSPQSWSLLRLVVSGGDQQLANEPLNTINVEEIQTEVMKNSVGVPLAVKTLATLLYFKYPQTEWLSFLRSDKLLPADHEDGILKNLKLNYDYLPSHLKRCLLLCSLFPKNYKIDVQVLIYKWIALGLVKSSPNGSEQSLYKLGLEYFMDLTCRSFFQEIKRDLLGNIDTCKMHDLVHDLAVSIAGSTYTQLNDPENEITGDTCYISLNHDLWSPSEVASRLAKAKRLRVFSVQPEKSTKWYQWGTTWDESSFETLVSNFASLRVLEFRNSGVEMLSHQLGELEHLRFLDLSFNDKIVRLPDSITMLRNLEVLDLFKCERFLELPKDLNKLENLSILNCGYCLALTHMPAGLGELTRLESLPCFVVGKDSSVLDHIGGLDELKNLNNLRGTLQIENLARLRVRGTTTALSPPLMAFIIGGGAHLKGKIHLQTLSLRWDDGRHGKGIREQIQFLKGSEEEDVHFDENLLESLRPHSGLNSFYVTGHKGRKLPSWICSLTQLVNLHLGWCNVQHDLHHLQGLPSL